MGNFFKDLRKLYLSLEKVKNNRFVERGKNIISVLAHQPLKDIKAINKRESYIEKNLEVFPEGGFRIHLRDKKTKYIDFLTGKKESLYLEIIFNGDEVILRWPMGHKVLDFEREREEKIYKELDLFLKNLFIYKPPEKELLERRYYGIN